MDRSDDGIFMFKQIAQNEFVQLFANKKLKRMVKCESNASKLDSAFVLLPLLQRQSENNTSFVTLTHVMENETLYVA